jgi:O-antigen ligase
MRGLAASIDTYQEEVRLSGGGLLAVASLLVWFVAAIALPMLGTRGEGTAPELLVGVSVIIPFMTTFFTGQLSPAISPRPVLLSLALTITLLLSVVGAKPEVETALAIAIVPIYLLTSASFTFSSPKKLVKAFRALAVVALAVLILAAWLDGDFRFFTGDYMPWERLDGGVHPNYFALTALVGTLFAISLRDPVRLPLIAVFFYLSWLAQSRTTMLCIAVCGFYVMLTWAPRVAAAVRRSPSLFPILTAGFLTAFGAVGFIVYRLFFGIVRKGEEAGGLSGREELWVKTLDLFSHKPVFGHGYRSQYTENLLGGVFTHNMWLSSLLEIGMFGSLVLAGVIIYALVAAYRHRRSDTIAEVGLLVLVVYLIYGVTEGRYINTGNPLSILFLFSLGYLWCLGPQQTRWRASSDSADYDPDPRRPRGRSNDI